MADQLRRRPAVRDHELRGARYAQQGTPGAAVLKPWVGRLLDLFYPRKCALCGMFHDSAICAICRSEFQELELKLRPPSETLDFSFSIFVYEGRAAQAVQRLKYARITTLAEPMSLMLRESARVLGLLQVDLVIPVPIHWSRRCYRGFNQSEMLAESFPPDLVDRDALKRIKKTRPQVGLSHDQRLTNLSGAFAAAQGVAGKRVLLLDDVLTSGQTARECARALKQAGALQVGALAFAGTPVDQA